MYTWNNTGDRVYWSGSGWYNDASCTSPRKPEVTQNEDGTTSVEAVTIHYSYNEKNITYKIYQPTDQNNNSGGGTDGETPGTAEESAG